MLWYLIAKGTLAGLTHCTGGSGHSPAPAASKEKAMAALIVKVEIIHSPFLSCVAGIQVQPWFRKPEWGWTRSNEPQTTTYTDWTAAYAANHDLCKKHKCIGQSRRLSQAAAFYDQQQTTTNSKYSRHRNSRLNFNWWWSVQVLLWMQQIQGESHMECREGCGAVRWGCEGQIVVG